MEKKVEGIVVRTTDYGETSKIVNIITEDEIIGTMAKGAKQLKSPLRSGTDVLSYGIFDVFYKKDKLSILKSITIKNPFNNIKKDISKISYASFITDLINQISKEGHSKSLFKLYIDCLLKIEEGFDPLIITNIFELKVLEVMGVKPVFDSCVICGNQDNIVTISSDKGGYLCSNCINEFDYITKPEVIKLLRMFYYVDVAKISKLSIKPEIKDQINHFIDEYYEKYTGLYLKSKKLIQEINEL